MDRTLPILDLPPPASPAIQKPRGPRLDAHRRWKDYCRECGATNVFIRLCHCGCPICEACENSVEHSTKKCMNPDAEDLTQ